MSIDEMINNNAVPKLASKTGSCCGNGHVELGSQAKQKSQPTKSGITTDIRIMQMCCPSEERIIRSKLADNEGIYSLEFKLLNKILTVVHHEAALPSILSAITTLGYEPEVEFAEKVTPLKHSQSKYLWLIIAAVLALGSEMVGWLGDYSWLSIALSIVAVALCGIETYKKGWVSLINYDLNMNALMSIAITGAFLLGEWPEAAMVMVLFSLAEMIEQNSLQKASNAIRGLLELSPALTTVLQTDGSWSEVDTKSIIKGAVVRVKPGERISLDGVITQGSSSVDQAPITGESIVVDKVEGDTVYAGTINGTGSFEFKVTAITTDTTLASIIKVVEQAQSNKAPIQRFIDKFARIYTPIVFLIAVGVAVIMPLFFAGDWQAWIYKALVLLVIACPCALVISTPVTVVSGLTAAARRGILVKGGVHLEQGRHIQWLALDKTGTITQGKPAFCDYLLLNNVSDNELYPKQLAMSLTSRSDHPVSTAITKGLQVELAAQNMQVLEVDDFQAMLGSGIQGTIAGQQLYFGTVRLAGKLNLLTDSDEALFAEYEKQGKTLNLLMTNSQILALFAVADTVKKESEQAIQALHKLNVKTIMLSGDNKHTANVIAKQVGIDRAEGELFPEDKLKIVEQLQRGNGGSSDSRLKPAAQCIVAMVGDGINDAPALAKSNLGFAMGALGADTAIETADVALMDDDLRKIPEFIMLSKKVHTILLQNISFAIAVKVLFLGITLAGFGDMWMAVFADVGASVLVVANGIRLLNHKTA
ncbi:MAG: heavy metal translocating P-type ATPase [Oceanospirillaceae bacterium]